jgi:hypothetical protein
MSELAVAHAARIKLPESYEAAKKAIAHCAELDECARWVDKAAAMAACARIAEDETMLKDAMRIQAHAVRHIGELIKLVPQHQDRRRELRPAPSRVHPADKQPAPRVSLSVRLRPRCVLPTYPKKPLTSRSRPPTRRP